jgi:tRNA(Ile)-lysidine synthase
MKRLQRREDLKLTDRIERHLKEFGVCRGDTLVVGVSGGPDSVCLLHLLKSISECFPLRLHIAHLNHGLRGEESIGDAHFVARLADEWKIPVSLESISVSALAKQKRISLQVAAREARYAFFQQIVEKLQSRWIALGHTADDQAETFLLRLLRGAGARGLSSIPPFREIQAAQKPPAYIIRPLLSVRRREILSYLKTKSIPYREDSTNLKGIYLRNRLRQEIVPRLTLYNPNLIETLCRTAELLREEQDFLLKQAAQALARLKVDQSGPGLALNRTAFLGLHKVLQRLVLREAIARVKGELSGINYRHLEDGLRLIRSGMTGKYLEMPGGIRIQLVYDRIWICSLQGETCRDAKGAIKEVSLSIPGEIKLASLGVRVKVSLMDGFSHSDPKQCAAFDLSKIHPPFTIRSRKPGDYFFPTGMGGRRKKLQDFFVDQKIPQQERDRIPLLTAAEGILWVMGRRLDGRFLASPDSRTVMVVEIKEN